MFPVYFEAKTWVHYNCWIVTYLSIFSNLRSRPLLKNCFRKVHNNRRDTSGENIDFECLYQLTHFDVKKRLPVQSIGTRKRRIISAKSTNWTGWSRLDTLLSFLDYHVIQLSVPNFVAASGNLVGKVPNVDDILWSKERHHPNTSLVKTCIAFEFQTNRKCFVHLRQVFVGFETKNGGKSW